MRRVDTERAPHLREYPLDSNGEARSPPECWIADSQSQTENEVQVTVRLVLSLVVSFKGSVDVAGSPMKNPQLSEYVWSPLNKNPAQVGHHCSVDSW